MCPSHREIQSPLVSVICLTYNHESYLRQALDSILMQETQFSYEIVLAEDSSTDGTRSICEEYQAKYPDIIKYVWSENNVGVWANEIRAHEKARGKYFAYCEGDDYWTDTNKLQKQVAFMEAHEDYMMCFHNTGVLNQSSRAIILNGNISESKEFHESDVFPNWVAHTSSFMIRRELWGKFLGMKHRNWLESTDTVLVLLGMKYGRVWGIKEEMSVYRMNNHSMMANENSVEVLGQYIRHLKCFLLNFRSINRKYCYQEIYEYDSLRIINNDGRYNSFHYLLDMLVWCPGYTLRMWYKWLKRRIKMLIYKI